MTITPPAPAQIQKARSIVSTLEKHPLVKIQEVEHHLDLLAVFHNVHHTIQDPGVVVDQSSDPPIVSARQALFLARAQHRFEAWIDKVLQRADRYSNSSLSADEIPPVDVLMFLHAYMIHPMSYHEDSMRVYPCLAGMGALLWKEVHALIDVGKHELIPTPGQVSLWEGLTSMPFDLPLDTTTTETVAIACPKCLAVCDFPWVNSSGTGVGQDFTIPCPGCHLTIDSDTLCVARFLKDASSSQPFACTILDHTGREDLESAHKISLAIRNMLETPNATEGDHFGWKMANIEAILLKDVDNVASSQDGIKKILHAYHHPAQSSIDIKAAVMRQRRFIALMHDIQWSGEKSSFDGKEEALSNAIVRYHHFFALSSELSTPALDIDIVFHTHQLSGHKYINDCLNILGTGLDHDDSVPKISIDHDISQCTTAWEAFYNTAYITLVPPLYSHRIVLLNVDSCSSGTAGIGGGSTTSGTGSSTTSGPGGGSTTSGTGSGNTTSGTDSGNTRSGTGGGGSTTSGSSGTKSGTGSSSTMSGSGNTTSGAGTGRSLTQGGLPQLGEMTSLGSALNSLSLVL